MNISKKVSLMVFLIITSVFDFNAGYRVPGTITGAGSGVLTIVNQTLNDLTVMELENSSVILDISNDFGKQCFTSLSEIILPGESLEKDNECKICQANYGHVSYAIASINLTDGISTISIPLDYVDSDIDLTYYASNTDGVLVLSEAYAS